MVLGYLNLLPLYFRGAIASYYNMMKGLCRKTIPPLILHKNYNKDTFSKVQRSYRWVQLIVFRVHVNSKRIYSKQDVSLFPAVFHLSLEIYK